MKLYNVYTIFIVLLALSIQSCSKMNDLHQEYLDQGETIYAARIDSVHSGAGKGRIQLEIFIGAQRIETVRIFWNDYKDSVDIKIGNQTGTFKTMVENLAEKSYIFQFVSIDKFGNKSLPFELTADVYGNNFQSILSNRTISDVSSFENGKITITWGTGAIDKGVRCDLFYKNTAGVQVTKKIPLSETSTVLTDVGSNLKYQTLFIPTTTAIDTFYTDFKAIPLITDEKVNKAGWKIIGVDSESTPDGLFASNVIDDDLSTFWFTKWMEDATTHPHWFILDMGKEVPISCIEVFRRQNSNIGQTKHQFLTSTNGTDWSDYGTFAMAAINSGQKFRNSGIPTARYIKYVTLEGPSSFATLAEINVYTPKGN